MFIKEVAIIFCVFYLTINGFAQHANGPSPAAQNKWIRQTAREMRRLDPAQQPALIEPAIIHLDDFYQCSYRLTGTGQIKTGNGDWIYLFSNSSHNNATVGDITLAMNNRKQFFVNRGHVCGGIIHFITNHKIDPMSVDQFFKHFTSDTDSAAWAPLLRKK